MRLRAILIGLLFAGLARAEIDVPAKIQSPPNPIVATVNVDVPEVAQTTSKWKIEGNGKAMFLPAGEHRIHAWAEPGTYTITYVEAWQAGGELDFVSEMARIVVTTEEQPDPGPDPEPEPEPEPDPDPQPVPTEDLQVYVIEEVEKRSQLPYGQVQAMTLPEIREPVDSFRLVDKGVEDADGDTPENLKPYLDAAAENEYPWLLLANPEGEIIWQGPVPETADAMRERLDNPLEVNDE